ncbi:MAG: site-2 protease family protein [archaeon]
MTNKKKLSILTFSKQEKQDLLISWVTISVAFAIVMGMFSNGSFDLITLFVALVAVGTGFVFHELAHREAAKSFGFHSEYRAWYPFLGISILLAIFTGFVFAAPGATYFIGENVSRKQNGIISIAGPLTNIALGFIFLGLLLFLGKEALLDNVLRGILVAVAQVNFFFAFFNMLPILMLDGSKVLAWDAKYWFITIAVAGIMTFFVTPILY